MENTGDVSTVERFLNKTSLFFGGLSAVALVLMMAITVVEVVGRALFNHSLYGNYELIGMLLVAAGPLGMALCQKEGNHITVTLVVDLLPPGVKAVLKSIALFLSLGIYLIISWKMIQLTITYYAKGRGGISADLGISLGHVSLVFSAGAVLFSLMLLLHFIQSLTPHSRR
jgi:TRAP-type C4-dicarboxylate transport system permease small subunit